MLFENSISHIYKHHVTVVSNVFEIAPKKWNPKEVFIHLTLVVGMKILF